MSQTKNIKLSQTSMLLSFLGFCVGIYTLWHHYKVNSGTLESASFCSVNEYVNCDAVALSSYSEIYGFPIAALLLIFYTAMLILSTNSFFSARKSDSSSKKEYAQFASASFTLSSLALIPTFYFAGVLFFKLELLCILCIIGYALNITIWALSALLFKNAESSKKLPSFAPKSSWLLLAIGTAAMALSPIAMQGIVGSVGIDKNMMSTILYQHSTAKQHIISTEGYPSLGSQDAPIVVVEYSDFQCPHCARASTVVPQVVRANPNARFVFKQFPLDGACNSSMQGGGRSNSCLAAKTAHCAFKLKGNDAFFRVEKEIFANQRNLSASLLNQIGTQKGKISEEDLKACISDPETHRAITDQVQEALAIGVTGTPAIYVNGRRLEYGVVASVLRAVLSKYQEALGNARK